MQEMKNSNIPQNWKILKFKYAFSLNKGLTITKEDLRDEGVPCVNYGEIHSKYGFEVIPEKHSLKYVESEYLESSPNMLLSKGNFIFADTSEDIEGVGNFTCLNSNTQVFAGYHTIIARLKTDFISRYYAYLFDSDIFRNQIRNRVSGIKVFSITQGILKNTNLLVPPLKTQQKIADFLDSKCSKIDSTIEQEKQHIEKLKEYRQSLITEAVTKGLDKNAPMKDSGIEWIGEIPQGWQVRKLRFLGSCQNGISKSGEAFGSGFPFITYSDVYKNSVLPSPSGLIESTEDEQKIYSVQKGDIFFTRTSETVEEIAFSSVCLEETKSTTFAGFLIRVRPKKDIINSKFASYYFRNIKNRIFFVKEMNLVTRASLSQELLKKLPVLLPPLDEQKQIADYLDNKTAQIDNAIAKKETLITKLQEYKKSLIFEAVTGKMEV